MKRLLLPLLAALALPTAVNAESYWLFVVGKRKGWSELLSEKFPMASLKACEDEALRLKSLGGLFMSDTNDNKGYNDKFFYSCIKGK